METFYTVSKAIGFGACLYVAILVGALLTTRRRSISDNWT